MELMGRFLCLSFVTTLVLLLLGLIVHAAPI